MLSDPIEDLLLRRRVVDNPRLDPWKVRIAREARGLTQAQLADALGYADGGAATISRIESYLMTAGPKRAAALARALQVNERLLLSVEETWVANRATYYEWVAAGRPDLRQWIAARKAASGTSSGAKPLEA